jgi:hypothetical protein
MACVFSLSLPLHPTSLDCRLGAQSLTSLCSLFCRSETPYCLIARGYMGTIRRVAKFKDDFKKIRERQANLKKEQASRVCPLVPFSLGISSDLSRAVSSPSIFSTCAYSYGPNSQPRQPVQPSSATLPQCHRLPLRPPVSVPPSPTKVPLLQQRHQPHVTTPTATTTTVMTSPPNQQPTLPSLTVQTIPAHTKTPTPHPPLSLPPTCAITR